MKRKETQEIAIAVCENCKGFLAFEGEPRLLKHWIVEIQENASHCGGPALRLGTPLNLSFDDSQVRFLRRILLGPLN
jgi:hypothetical protein